MAAYYWDSLCSLVPALSSSPKHNRSSTKLGKGYSEINTQSLPLDDDVPQRQGVGGEYSWEGFYFGGYFCFFID